MIWFDNIYDLQYYHQPKGVPCYCESVAYPFDLFLQGHIYNGNGSYSLNIYVYSPDGLTQYEDATSYFDFYFGAVPGAGYDFFNARLKSFSPAMCAHECYILRAVVTQQGINKFNKYTERYCQNDCCDVPHNIRFEQVGFAPNVINNDNNDPALQIEDTVVTGGVTPEIYVPSGDCGEQLIRLISKFDCIDKFTGDFYGSPDTVYAGNANFEYRKVTSLKGRVVRRPREIKREVSYNCMLLKSESTAQYLLEGFEFLPAWKMYELEGQLHANRLFVDDFSGVKEYHYSGGTPVKQLNKCFELFKLEATLEDCSQRQVFGCAPGCNTNTSFDGSNMMFAIPADYNNGGFYNSNGERVAHNYEGLMDYFRTRDGASAINDIDTGSMQCSVYKVLSVTSSAQIDTHIYYDNPVPGNKIYGQQVADISEFCAGLPNICACPVVGSFTVALPVCTAAITGPFTVVAIDVDNVAVAGYGNWVDNVSATSAAVYNNEVTLNIEVVNDAITEDPNNPTADVYVSDVIGVIGSIARPATQVVLNSTNSNLPEEVGITIDSSGLISYYGPVTVADPGDVTIQLTNITYNI